MYGTKGISKNCAFRMLSAKLDISGVIRQLKSLQTSEPSYILDIVLALFYSLGSLISPKTSSKSFRLGTTSVGLI